MNMICTYCGLGILDSEMADAWYQATVWLHGPKKDSAFDRQNTGMMMHASCKDLYAAKVSPDQEAIF